MNSETGILKLNINVACTYSDIQYEPIVDSLYVKRDSFTRSIIDPVLIAKQKDPVSNESYLYFYNKHWQKIIKHEAQRENYSTVKVISPETKVISDTKKYYFEGNSDWLLAVGVAMVVLIAWIRIYYGKVLAQTFRSTVNQQSARKLNEQKSNFLQKASSILIVIYIISSGMFLYEFINYFHIKLFNFENILLFLLCLASILLFYILKSFLYWISGFIIKSENEIMELLKNNNIYYRAIGVMLLPIIISIPYVPDNIAEILLYCGIAVFCVSFIMRIIRGFVLSFKVKLSLFYSFLYFCMLEILPILYVYRIINEVI